MSNRNNRKNKKQDKIKNKSFSSAHIDYAKQSNYFKDDNEIVNELSQIEKQKKYVIWIQEYSKKIVTVTFAMFIVFSFAELALTYFSFKQGYVSGLDTLISETHLTFREVIGGYLIKAGVENAFKIGGNYFVGVSDAKLQMFHEQLKAKGFVNDDNSTSNATSGNTTSTINSGDSDGTDESELDYDFETIDINPNRYN